MGGSSRRARDLVLISLLGTATCAPPPPDRGAVVETVEPWGAAAEAGIVPGDVLEAWTRAGKTPAHGSILSPLDVISLERMEAPRGVIVLRLRRGAKGIEAALRRGEWEMSTRPALSAQDQDRHEDAERLAADGELRRASESWEAIAAALQGRRSPDALWLRTRIGRAYAEARDVEAARRAFVTARAGVNDPLARSLTFDIEGEALFAAGEYTAAAEALAEAATLREAAPLSPALAWSLRELGRARFHLVDLDGAEEPLSRALALYREAGSSALESSDALNLLAGVAYRRGDLEKAGTLYLEAAALREPLAPESPKMGGLQANLGLVAYDRGDLDVAERYFLRALEIDDRAGDPRDVGYTLNFLGLLARDKGDFESARAYYQRALQAFGEASPGGVEVAGMLNNLGNLARREGDLTSAESHHREALDIRERLLEENLDVAASLHNLASIFRLQGHLAEARPLLRLALEIKERKAPESLLVATTLFELGELHRGAGELGEARNLHRRALAIRSSAAPESDVTAESLAALGGLAREEGRDGEAEKRWREAIALVESRRGRLAFTTAERSRFSARFYELYRELAELLSRTGRAREAFDLVERARARTLRVMMAQRDFAGTAGVPADLVRERRRLEQSLEGVEARLTRVSVAAPNELARHHDRKRGLRRELDELNSRIREISPRLSLLEDPVPVSIEDIRRELPPGTLLLSYAIGSEVTLLFTLGSETDGPGVGVQILPLGEEDLERRVGIFRALIERGAAVGEVEPALLAQGRRLYDLLLAPVEESVAAAERLVVISEGPLLTLPFAALVRSAEPREYLFEAKPLSHVASAGVLIELRRARPAESGGIMVAFGDPDLPEGAGTRTNGMGRLPFAREEAQRIGALYEGSARVLVGAAASEERARGLGPEARMVHFAAHALPDPRFPLDSALVLAPGEGADGWLHAWEIAEALRLDADLVTLSGCETGLGRELQGEGILGLARAFQYAGARSVLVSLWAVPDRSTRELMVRFYENLERGLPKDAALRAARGELLNLKSSDAAAVETRHPYHWAGFRLIGDGQ